MVSRNAIQKKKKKKKKRQKAANLKSGDHQENRAWWRKKHWPLSLPLLLDLLPMKANRKTANEAGYLNEETIDKIQFIKKILDLEVICAQCLGIYFALFLFYQWIHFFNFLFLLIWLSLDQGKTARRRLLRGGTRIFYQSTFLYCFPCGCLSVQWNEKKKINGVGCRKKVKRKFSRKKSRIVSEICTRRQSHKKKNA